MNYLIMGAMKESAPNLLSMFKTGCGRVKSIAKSATIHAKLAKVLVRINASHVAKTELADRFTIESHLLVVAYVL
jgi:hypothetical protein